MNTALMFSTGKDEWQTPPELFAALHAEFHFAFDIAATKENRQCLAYLGPDHSYAHARDALAVKWACVLKGEAWWCNPPYSKGQQSKFIAKAANDAREFGTTIVMLLPARTDTKAFHAHIWDGEQHQPRAGVEVRFLKGRLRFVGAKDAAPFPSMVVVFRGQEAAR